MIEVAPDILALLLLVAFFAGAVDAIAGGGGLIVLPVLVLAGAPPVVAIATNKVQAVFGAGTAALTYARGGHVNLRRQAPLALLAFVVAGGGALFTASLPTELIRLALPVLLVGVALFFAFKPGLDDMDRTARLTPFAVALTLVPVVAFYDGVIGPGAGAFYMIGFVTLAGYGVLKATAHTKFLNFSSNLGGLAVYALVASPWWITGLAMGLAQIAGAWVGSRLAMRVGSRLIKPLLVISASALAAKLLWDMI
ncbi:TSUP family transporter [Thalassorhabdomicrobium marinisediminis]|uniref:TSUP family transporter n=1 Tax=Thalassorhabdomicrobium marinisediminis TaxID=2170577 RepID=UPI002492C2DC|nr:TSUP family transporter [Thalassorhabdomicrobium marinisediminis]